MNIKEQLVDECIDIIKRGDVKTEIKNMFRPIIGMLLKDIYPYIFISMLFIIICFLLILGILLSLLKMNKSLIKITKLTLQKSH
jgi:hypothetical protein